MIDISINEGFLDIREGEENRLFINKSIHDLRDMFGRTSDRSRSIVLPRSANNISLLGSHSARLGRDYRGLACQVLMSGVPVLEDAQLVIIGEDANHFEATIIGGAASFYNLLPEDSIRDLDFTADNFEWILAEYVARISNTSGVVTAWAQWLTNESYQKYLDEGGVPAEEVEAVDIDKAGFCYFTKDILAKIFDNTGLDIILELDNAQEDYDNTVVVCPMPQIFLSHESQNIDAGYVGFNADFLIPVPNAFNRIPFDRVDVNEGLVWDAGLFQYEPNIAMPVRLLATIRRTTVIINNTLEVRLMKIPAGGSPEVLQTGSWSIIQTLMNFDVFDIGAPGDIYYMEARTSILGYTIAEQSTFFEFINQASQSREVEIDRYLPDISQKDLVKNVFNLFHIVVSDVAGTITLSLFDRINLEPQIDLQERIASDRQVKYSPRIPNYGQLNHFKYAEELLVLGSAFNEAIHIDNNTLTDNIVKIELFFAGSDGSLFATPGRVTPSFDIEYQREDKNAIHIIGDGLAFTTYSTQEANDLEDNDLVFIGADRYEVKRSFDNKSGEFTHIGIVNTNPQEWSFVHYTLLTHTLQLARVNQEPGAFVYYQGSVRDTAASSQVANLLTWDYLLGKYYLEYRFMIQDVQFVHLWVDIPNTVFLALNSLAPIYVLGATYYLNKVEQYKEDGITRLELIRFN